MKYHLGRMRRWAVPIMAAAVWTLAAGPSSARDFDKLMMKAVGRTSDVSPVIVDAVKHAAMNLIPAQRKLALECYHDNVCDTGHGTLTVAYADGFGENVWREVTKMEFIEQALTYPQIRKIIYRSAHGDTAKAISDMQAYTAQRVNVIVMFADAGAALLPAVREATQSGIQVVLNNGTTVGGHAGKDYLSSVSENICQLGVAFVNIVRENSTKKPTTIVELGGTPGNPLSATWQKCAEKEIANDKNLKLLGKADTNWTQEGTFKAMSGFLSEYGSVDAVLYEYADGFRGGVRAYQAAKKPLNVIVALRTDEQGLFCDWQKIDNPNFKIFYASGQNDQARFALTAAMMKLADKTIPSFVDVPFKMHRVVKGLCNPALPMGASVSTLVDDEMLEAMFPKK